jgi:hypothetical protein
MANPKPTLFETLAQQAATASQRANVYEQACASTATKIVEKLQAAIGATPTTLRVMKLTASAQDAERQVGQGVMLPRGNFVFGFEVVVGEVIVPFRWEIYRNGEGSSWTVHVPGSRDFSAHHIFAWDRTEPFEKLAQVIHAEVRDRITKRFYPERA